MNIMGERTFECIERSHSTELLEFTIEEFKRHWYKLDDRRSIKFLYAEQRMEARDDDETEEMNIGRTLDRGVISLELYPEFMLKN